MYLGTTPRKNTDGSVVRYLQLAHNTWDPNAKRSRVRVLYNFGREDDTNRAALERLVASVTRFLEPDRVLAATAGEGLACIESRPLGGVWVLDGLWRRLGIDQTMRRLLQGRRLDASPRRVLFPLGAHRAPAPPSDGGGGPPRCGCCARWSPTGRWRRPRSWPQPAGSTTTWPSRGWSAPATTPATGRWTGCWRSTLPWSGRSSATSPTSSTSRSTCCSSTPPP